jgi:hypothetical protein
MNSITPAFWEETMIMRFLKVTKPRPPADAIIRMGAFFMAG